MKIGLFGGTFNPIHLGHIGAALEVKKVFALEKIYLIPSALPPHKEPRGVSDARDRMEMARLAVLNHPDFCVSDVELNRSGPSYTIDTVRHFKSILPDDADLHFILGLDAFLEIDTWKSYRDLFQLISFIVMTRPDRAYRDTAKMRQALAAFIESRMSVGYRFSLTESCYVHNEKQPVYMIDVPPADISSTMIRKHVSEGRSVRAMVPESVADFITNRGLYL
ncbi:MAG: nicotinate-nucleotide adenylyltransferase [Pseudomonadota bacterium]